jgi:hypothetical protein
MFPPLQPVAQRVDPGNERGIYPGRLRGLRNDQLELPLQGALIALGPLLKRCHDFVFNISDQKLAHIQSLHNLSFLSRLSGSPSMSLINTCATAMSHQKNAIEMIAQRSAQLKIAET